MSIGGATEEVCSLRFPRDTIPPPANLATLHVETVRTEIAWDNFGLLDFLAKHGFTPCQRLVPSKRVE